MSVWRVGRAPPRGQSPDQVVRTMCVRNSCLQYLDSRDVKGIADGADVTTWPARIGADPTQPSAPLRPSYDVAGFVDFDNVGESMPTPAIDLSTSSELTFVIACHTRDAAGSGRVWEHGTVYFTTDGVSCALSSKRPAIGHGGPGAAQIGYRTSAKALRDVAVIGGAFDRAASLDAIYMHTQDGEIIDFAATDTNDTTGDYGANASQLGSRDNGASLPLNGGVAVGVWLPVLLPRRERNALVMAVAQIVGVR